MALSKIIQIAWKGLNRNKLRSLLTMLGVIIGVSAVIIMISVSTGTETTIKEQIQGLGTNLLFVQSSFTRGGPAQQGPPTGGLVYDDIFAIAGIQGVTGVSVEQDSEQTVKVGSVSLDSVNILGTTSDFPQVRGMEVADGRYFTQTELDRKQKVAVLGASLAEELFGDATPVGQVLTVGNTKLTVVGVMKEKGVTGNTDYNMVLFTPIKVVFEKFTPFQFARMFGDRVRMIYVQVENQEKMEDIIYQIELLLAKRHKVSLDEPDFVIRTQQDIIDTQEATSAAFRNLLAWVASVSLIVGGIGIMNIMLVSVTERTREIGIRQSVGATPNDIRWQFLMEALLLSLAGGVVGVLVGVGGSYLFGALGSMRTVVAPGSILLAFISAAAVGIFFGYYPANKAAQLDPIEALRHE
ncbi:MAG: ABC transporter permease [Anaerolineales bacterium]|nr:ABC transporter permease [Anaerolineales bacterium]